MSFTLGPSQLPMLSTQAPSQAQTRASMPNQVNKPQELTDTVDPRMRQAAEGFEALFLNQMLSAGRKASLGDDLLGGTGVTRMQGMLDQELTQNATGAAGLGMADAIVRQFAPYAQKG